MGIFQALLRSQWSLQGHWDTSPTWKRWGGAPSWTPGAPSWGAGFRDQTIPFKTNSSFSAEDIIWFSYADTQSVQIGECQICREIIKIASNRVHMARRGLIMAQNRSHQLQEASGMPPGPQSLVPYEYKPFGPLFVACCLTRFARPLNVLSL